MLCTFMSATLVSAAPPISLRNSEEIYAGLASATNFSIYDPDLRSYYNTLLSRLPRNGAVSEATSPMRFAFLGLAEKFCGKMIETDLSRDDRNSRRVFKEIDAFSGVSQFQPKAIQATTDGLFSVFLNRLPSEKESTIIKYAFDEYLEAFPSETNTQIILTMACTAVATSPEFLLF